jgi:hypothetical protein
VRATCCLLTAVRSTLVLMQVELPPVVPHRSLGCDDLEPLPSKYDFLSDPVDLASPTSVMLLARIQESLPDAKLVSVRRFANKNLWTTYVMQREIIIPPQNGGDPNVKLLFHGTKEPSLILGSGRESNSDGFDARMAKQGAYSAAGVGAYFASHAAYPVKIHPRRANADGTFDLIVAEVACGAVSDQGDKVDETTRGLQRPPPLRGALLHHSVRGTERSIGVKHTGKLEHGEQYIIFNHTQAYPHFLITIELPSPVGSFSGPHADKYLSGYAADGGKQFQSLAEAQAACLADTTARGVTCNGRDGTFTVRKGAELCPSPSKEISWLRAPRGILYGPWIGAEQRVEAIRHVHQALWIYFEVTHEHTKMVAASVTDPKVAVGKPKVVDGQRAHDPVSISAAWDEGLTTYSGCDMAGKYLLKGVICLE